MDDGPHDVGGGVFDVEVESRAVGGVSGDAFGISGEGGMGDIANTPADVLKKAIRHSHENSMKGTQEYVVSENRAILADDEFVDCECAEDCWCKRHGCTGHYVIREMTFERFLDTGVKLRAIPAE